MQGLMQDVRSGIRQLFKHRTASLVAVLTLALGIGVSSALFSIIDVTMLRPLPYPNPQQLVAVSAEVVEPNGQAYSPTPSMADMRTWQESVDVFSVVAGSGGAFYGRILDGAEPERLEVNYFTEHYLSLFGVTPVIGRDFVREDCEPRAPLVALLGYGFWQSRYGGQSDVLGTTIRLDNAVATVVGVLPAWFNASTPVSLPLRVPAAQFAWRGTGSVYVEARLQPGVTVADAAARLTARMPAPTAMGQPSSVVVTSQLEGAMSRYRTTVNVFIGAVALVVAMAAVNVAGLLLARGAARQAELAVRASLGASRRRLVQQLLIESFVLAIPAGALAVALAGLSLDALVANIPLSLPVNSPVTLNVTVLALTLALLLLTTFVFGLVPAIRLSRANAGGFTGRANRQVSSTLSRRGGQVLIGAEVALAVVLVAGAGLMLRSFWRISHTDLGFNADGLVTMRLMPLAQSQPEQKEYYRTLLQQLRTVQGVSAATLVDNFAPAGGTAYTDISTAAAGDTFSTVFEVMPGYFETIGARLSQGRLLNDSDYASQFRGVVINESAAAKLFPGDTPVGRELSRATGGHGSCSASSPIFATTVLSTPGSTIDGRCAFLSSRPRPRCEHR